MKLAERKIELDAKKSKKDIEIAESRFITERFSKAVEQLVTNNNITVVMSGIYTLSKIASDSPEYHFLVMKVLASFIRGKPLEYAPQDSSNSQGYPKVRLTIQEAITAIGQRNYRYDVSGETLDLSRSLFVRANLVNANFRGINLREANFGNTNLEGVDFSGADLEGAIFYGSDLRNAILKDTKLKGAKYCSETRFPSNFDPDIEGMEKQ
ncbi:pentapeptide repeat-containing protein [Pseudanabaena sp. Chao 1811]|uniref:pentapeptide repeat-containing protein n=1 Tax=Pseudanabaena sp. Chao 1811 TaxID=2963092 RepID=UPI0022F3C127|nr:pentapeptide repeat-containing protein [Pseudanabaena sp. Chao 1811]